MALPPSTNRNATSQPLNSNLTTLAGAGLPIPLAQGGTAAASAAAARTSLGLGTAATEDTGDFLASSVGAVGSTNLAADAVGAAALSPASLRLITFMGRNGAGACTATGLKVGDKVSSLLDASGPPFTDARSDFQSTITVNDQIQQVNAGDLSSKFYFLQVIAKGG